MSGVYSIVKKHGGDATVIRSKINEGTTIEIVFPISREQVEVNVASDKETKGQRKRVPEWQRFMWRGLYLRVFVSLCSEIFTPTPKGA